MAHGLPLKPLKPWRERIRCVRVQHPPEFCEIPLTRHGSTIQSFYLGLACSHHGNRNYFCPSHQLSVWQRFRPSTVARIWFVRPEPYPIRLRVRVYDCEICTVPRGTHSPHGIDAVAYSSSRQVWGLMLNHPAQSLFIGCFPMGAATLINGALVSNSVYLSGTCV